MDRALLYKDYGIPLMPTSDSRFITDGEICILGHTIPKGWSTNGANIPRILWSFYPPNDPEMIPIVLIHDFLCDINTYKRNVGIKDIDWDYPDKEFRRAAVFFGVSKIKYEYYLLGIRSYTKYIRPLIQELEDRCIIDKSKDDYNEALISKYSLHKEVGNLFS